jgi:O-antigen ligase
MAVQGCSAFTSAKGKFFGFRMSAILLVSLLLVGMVLEAADIPIGDILLARTIDRIGQSEAGGLEDFDDAIVTYLSEHPTSAVTGVGLGNMHLYANSYLTPEVAEYASGTAFSAKAQYLRFISEIGLIGLALFLLWFWDVIRQVKEWSGSSTAPANLRLLAPFGVTSLVIFLAAGSVAPQFYLTVGVISAAHSMRQSRSIDCNSW